MNKETKDVISHLQIMSTWARNALDYDANFFEPAQMEDIEKWSREALELLKPVYKSLDSDGRYLMCGNCGNRVSQGANFCSKCGRPFE